MGAVTCVGVADGVTETAGDADDELGAGGGLTTGADDAAGGVRKVVGVGGCAPQAPTPAVTKAMAHITPTTPCRPVLVFISAAFHANGRA